MSHKPATSIIEYRNGSVLKTVNALRSATIQTNDFLKPYYPDSEIMPIIAHEVKALKMLEKYNIAPVVKDYGDNFIEMSYVGKDIAGDLPADQIGHIVEVLKTAGVDHNDLAYDGDLLNCTIILGKLYLIDFALASINDVPEKQVVYKKFWREDYISDEHQLRLREKLS